MPGEVGIVHVIGGVGQPLHLVVQPLAAPGLAQPLQHAREDAGEVGHVPHRIVELPLVERAAAPVGEARALVELHARHALDQVGIADLLAHAERHRRNLGIEQRVGGAAGQVMDDLDILPAGMHHLQHVLVGDHQVEQRLEIDARRQRINRGSFLPVRDLHKAELRPIGVLAHEFGINRDEIAPRQPSAELGKGRGVGDERQDAHGSP